MAEEEAGDFKPPYLPFATWWRFVEELSAYPLPPVIDRSLMSTKSGSDQVNLLSSLRTFGMIDDERRVQPAFVELAAADSEVRKEKLRELVQKFYSSALDVSAQNGTEQQLHECFRDKYGVDGADTRRKSVTFFLHAARRADIPLSSYFPSTRAGSGSPGQKRARPKKKQTNGVAGSGTTAERVEVPTRPKSEYETSVNLQTGGTMTLTVSVNPLNLRGEDREFFYGIVDMLADYAEQHEAKTPAENGNTGVPQKKWTRLACFQGDIQDALVGDG